MYAKILHGKAFGGLVNYANDPRKNATIVCASSGINLSSNQCKRYLCFSGNRKFYIQQKSA